MKDYKQARIDSEAARIIEKIKGGFLLGGPIDTDNTNALIYAAYLLGAEEERQTQVRNRERYRMMFEL